MVLKTISPASSSTVDPTPPARITTLENHEPFCFFAVPYQEGETANQTAYSNMVFLRSFATLASRDSNLLQAHITSPLTNVEDCPDIRLRNIAFIHDCLLGLHFVDHLNTTSDTNVDTPRIPSIDKSLAEDIDNLVVSFSTEPFDSQSSYDLTEAFRKLMDRSGKSVVFTLETLIRERKFRDHLVYEILVAIGRVQHLQTAMDRFELLVSLLNHPVPLIRDGAVAGLSFMDNRKALPYLRKALAAEGIPTIKGNIEIAIKDLEGA